MRSTKNISISVPPDFLIRLDETAKEESRTRSELLREALRRYMQDREWRRLTHYAIQLDQPAGSPSEEEVMSLVEEYRSEHR